jgi:hypothetical protein
LESQPNSVIQKATGPLLRICPARAAARRSVFIAGRSPIDTPPPPAALWNALPTVYGCIDQMSKRID